MLKNYLHQTDKNEPIYKCLKSPFCKRKKKSICMVLTLCTGAVPSEFICMFGGTTVSLHADLQMTAARDLQAC